MCGVSNGRAEKIFIGVVIKILSKKVAKILLKKNIAS